MHSGAKICNFNVGYVLIRGEKDIFGLQVSVRDVFLVHVSHTGKYLSHYDGDILLCEAAANCDLVVKFTSFAYPRVIKMDQILKNYS